jgi:1,3-beta-glucanosyltransferase GAS3
MDQGYNTLVDMFGNSTVPVFFSEYGCNKVMPRVFDEVQALYGNQMTSLSGGLVYEYSQEEEDFGLVTINSNSTVSLGVDYDNLQSQYNKLNITLIQSTNATATQLSPPACSSGLITNSGFSTDFNVPAQPDGASDLINNGIKNPTQGKLVDVSETNVPMAVYGSSGVQIQNLAIRKLSNDDTNTPNGDSTSPSGTGSAAKPSSTKGDASMLTIASGSWVFLITFFAMVLTVL